MMPAPPLILLVSSDSYHKSGILERECCMCYFLEMKDFCC